MLIFSKYAEYLSSQFVSRISIFHEILCKLQKNYKRVCTIFILASYTAKSFSFIYSDFGISII